MGQIKYNNQDVPENVPKTSVNPVNKEIEIAQSAKIEQGELVAACQQVFDSVITRNYLHELSACQVKPLVINSGLTKVRWYKIDKIVKEKDVFFTDKLSMLYMSLHKTAKNVILILNKNNNEDVEIYLGARDFSGSNSVSGEILEAGLNGYFPGIEFKSAIIPDLAFLTPAISSVSAIASLRDDKKEDFVQGIERLINATSTIGRFRAFFIADSVGNEEVNDMIAAFNNLHTSLAPAETLQMSFNESDTKGVSESFTKNFSESIGESISKTVTHSEGHSETQTDNETTTNTTNYSPNILKSIWTAIFGGKSGESRSKATSRTKSIGKNFSDSEANQKGTSKGTTEGTAEQNGTNESKTSGYIKQITYSNRTAKYYLDILDKHLERLQNGNPFGLWSVATYFVANDQTTAQQLSSIYRGSIIGEESGLSTCAINTWTERNNVDEICRYLGCSLNPRFDFNSVDVSAGSIVNSKELAIHLSLPQSSVPGIIVQERASFARNVFSSKKHNDEIHLGNIVHLGQESTASVNLDIDELTKHLFVTGSTGSGKSNAIYLLLQELYKKGNKFLVVEPAKGEYKNIFGNKEDVYVYGSNPTQTQLIRINPFSFEDGIHVYEHIDRLVEIFNACWPMYAAMPVVLKKSITDAYRKCGWDLDSSTQNIKTPYKLFPTFKDVVACLRDFINSSEYSAETKGDYKGSLETRLLSMSEGLTGMMLNNSTGNLSDKDLFKQNVIIDLSRVGNTETKSLIMGLIIMKMSEFYQIHGSMNSSLNHVTVLEEAHNILKRTSTTQLQESSNLAGKSVEMICNSIAEMRTYGEGFIIADQSPSQVDMAAIRNTNTKLIMALPEAEDREVAGKSIGLTDEQIEEIGRQKVGEAIVYQNDWEEAVRCKIRKYEYDDKYSYYKKKDTYQEVDTRNALRKILIFLFSYCNDGVFSDKIDDLRSNIIDSRLMSSDKYSLLKLLDDYEQNGVDMSKTNHIKLMETVASILGLSAQIEKLLSVKNNATEINDAIKKQIEDIFPYEDDSFYRFCVRCSLRVQASKSKRITEIYNNWIKQYCSK